MKLTTNERCRLYLRDQRKLDMHEREADLMFQEEEEDGFSCMAEIDDKALKEIEKKTQKLDQQMIKTWAGMCLEEKEYCTILDARRERDELISESIHGQVSEQVVWCAWR